MEEDAGYAAKVSAAQRVLSSSQRTASETVYTIPVVVHVIHNGEAVGVGQNITDAQIQSAITALNQDFRALNSDTLAPSHPWYNLQADVKIEFCLAKQDTTGAATTGIVRYNKGQAAWTTTDFDNTVMPSTIWDRTKYMNIWTTTFAAPDDQTLGYATFPEWASATSDGMVIGATYFGTTGNLSFGFDKNRTATHEVGHYLGLYHIWGDATCGDDYVSDTPTQEAANESNCPTFPHNVGSSCNPGLNGEMFMNYMDYTLDNCMQLFTTGQKSRMRTQFETYRMSLASSNGCNIPTSVVSINSDQVNLFPNPAAGNVTIQVPSNYGLNAVAIYDLSGNLVASQNASGEQTTIDVSDLSNGNYQVQLNGAGGVVNKSLVVIQ